MFKDIVFLLKNGSIEKIENSIPLLSNFKMLTKDYIKITEKLFGDCLLNTVIIMLFLRTPEIRLLL